LFLKESGDLPRKEELGGARESGGKTQPSEEKGRGGDHEKNPSRLAFSKKNRLGDKRILFVC